MLNKINLDNNLFFNKKNVLWTVFRFILLVNHFCMWYLQNYNVVPQELSMNCLKKNKIKVCLFENSFVSLVSMLSWQVITYLSYLPPKILRLKYKLKQFGIMIYSLFTHMLLTRQEKISLRPLQWVCKHFYSSTISWNSFSKGEAQGRMPSCKSECARSSLPLQNCSSEEVS